MPAALTTPVFRARRSPWAPAWVACALGLALPVLATGRLLGSAADALGDRIVAPLLGALAPVSASLVSAEPEPALELAVTAPAEQSRTSPRAARGHGPKSSPAHAIRISSAQVLALAARGVMPAATPVRATPNHPAGLQLLGVSALGVGLQDGDILTEAAGQKASSVAAVVGLVLAARARHSSEISGRFSRAGVAYALTVEQPYPPST